jgi:hypothetical protein
MNCVDYAVKMLTMEVIVNPNFSFSYMCKTITAAHSECHAWVI